MHGFIPYVVSAISWVGTWVLDQQLSFLHYATGVSVVFLPAGIRTLAIFAFGFRGAVGIFAGSLITANAYFTGDRQIAIESIVAISMISAFSAYIAMEVVCRWRKIQEDLSSLNFNGVMYIVISQGVLSATLHKVIFYAENINQMQNVEAKTMFINWLAMMLGDVTGSMIVLTGIWAVFNRLYSKHKV